MTARALQRLRSSEGGVTLTELVVALPILTLIVAALTLTLTYSVGFSGEAQSASNLQLEARSTLATLGSDLRQTYTGVDTLNPIESVGPVLTFYSPDRATPMHLRRISYRFANGALERSVTTSTNTGPTANWTWPAGPGPWTTEVSGLTSATFSAYTGQSPPVATTDMKAVRSIVIALSGATTGSKKRSYDFQTTVDVRQTVVSS